jgi:DNA-binding Lrp family transcriptional regulator
MVFSKGARVFPGYEVGGVMTEYRLDPLDRELIRATQGGFPLDAEPYLAVAKELGISQSEVLSRLGAMLCNGIIRRIGVVVNHYALGYVANGMSVWNVSDDIVDLVGQRIGALPFVTHCYRRPRHLPDWPYNLFAMVHGTTRDDVASQVAEIKALLEKEFKGALTGHDVLFSTAILKKSGVRLRKSRVAI